MHILLHKVLSGMLQVIISNGMVEVLLKLEKHSTLATHLTSVSVCDSVFILLVIHIRALHL